jgi:hypothetical protein
MPVSVNLKAICGDKSMKIGLLMALLPLALPPLRIGDGRYLWRRRDPFGIATACHVHARPMGAFTHIGRKRRAMATFCLRCTANRAPKVLNNIADAEKPGPADRQRRRRSITWQ